jgi:selenocysteine lyase/cysteine desulfurase
VTNDARRDYRRAREVRRLLADVYGAAPDAAVFLAPGTLVGLRLVLEALAVKRVALTTGEYFDARSFPDARVDAVRAVALPAHLAAHRADAVVASVVTWRGERLPVETLFRQLRRRMGAAAPLLVADFCHAGAAGFPRVADSGADVVVGDVTKWITPPPAPDRLAFLWFRTAGLRVLAQRIFAPFYLAAAKPSSALEARWVDPDALAQVVARQQARRVTRQALVRRYRADLKLAARMARWCYAAAPTSPLVWVRTAAGMARIPDWVSERGLLWRPPGGGARVMCRSDLAP